MTKAIEVGVTGYSSPTEEEITLTGLFVRGVDIPAKKFDEITKDNLSGCSHFFTEEMVLGNAHYCTDLEDWELDGFELVEVA
jgi:hypothetical protein